MTGRAWFAALLPAMPDAGSILAKASYYSPVVLFIAIGAGVMFKLLSRGRGVSDGGDFDAFWGEAAPLPLPILPGAVGPSASAPTAMRELGERAPDRPGFIPLQPVPEGADVAARARFVAMALFASETIAPARPPARALGTDTCPLRIDCQPMRFTVTLGAGVLRYRLQLGNHGTQALGPLIVRADLATAGPAISYEDLAISDQDELPICHYLDGLAVGGGAELVGEQQLSLPGIAAMRLGAAELLLPLLRVQVESAGHSRPTLSCWRCFAIGMPSASVNRGIQPFQLDTGPGIWRFLVARRMEIPDADSLDQFSLDAGPAQS